MTRQDMIEKLKKLADHYEIEDSELLKLKINRSAIQSAYIQILNTLSLLNYFTGELDTNEFNFIIALYNYLLTVENTISHSIRQLHI